VASLIKPNPEQTSRLKRWRTSTFWVMLLGYVGYYLCRKNLSAAFPLLEDAFQFSNEDLGLIASMSTIAYAAGKFINGPLADKFGGRRFFLLGMAGGILFNLVFASVASLTAFVVVWCGCRFFLSMGWGGIVKTIGAWYEPKRHGTVMGLISINFQFGGVAATLFSGLLVAYGLSWIFGLQEAGLMGSGMAQWLAAGADLPIGAYLSASQGTSAGFLDPVREAGAYAVIDSVGQMSRVPGAGWRLLFLCPAVIVCLVFVWSCIGSRDHPNKVIENIEFPPKEEEPQENPRKRRSKDQEETLGIVASMKDMLRSPLFLSLLLFSFLTTILRSIFMFWIPKFLTDIGMGTSNAIIKSALFPFLGALGTILLGWYTDRYSTNGNRAKIMWIMLIALSACLFGIGASAQFGLSYAWLIVILIGLCGFFLLGPYSMASGCLTLDIVGHKRAGACSGLLDGTGYVGAALATWLVGKGSDGLGWSVVFSVTGAVALISAGSAYLMSTLFQRKARLEKDQKSGLN
jgi:sugar phosphate permease